MLPVSACAEPPLADVPLVQAKIQSGQPVYPDELIRNATHFKLKEAVGSLIIVGSVILGGIFFLLRRYKTGTAFLFLAVFAFLVRSLMALYIDHGYSAYQLPASASSTPAAGVPAAGRK